MSNLSNILYIHSHDTGRYIQPYGWSIPTPHLQKLAEKGVLFRKAFCAAPTCSPSRAALLTGQSAHSSGMLGLAHRGFRLKDYQQHLVHTLKEQGYTTALSGIQHVAHEQNIADIGYDAILSDRKSAETGAVRFLSEKHNTPFFLDVGFFETHRDGKNDWFNQNHQEDSRYVTVPPILPDIPTVRSDMADYMLSARILDQKIGSVLSALEASSYAQNTLVIYTTDHGIAFPRMKCNLTDHGTGVSLIMTGPGPFQGGKVVDTLISQMDLFPTLCEFLNIQAPSWLQGRSFMPALLQGKEEINEEIFAEVNFHGSYEPKRAVRTTRWKYICNYSEMESPILPNCDNSPSKTLLIQNGWKETVTPKHELYDLIFDPNECHNLADNPSYQDVLLEMQKKLKAWMERTQDPLLDGPIPLPPGTFTTPETAISV